MEESNRHVVMLLDHLYLILDAGERGYAVAAANVNNRALKLLFKTFARQRAEFKGQLREQIENLRAQSPSMIRMMAMIHRGRINIFAALAIGELNRERVVIREVLVGERAALRAYQKALNSGLTEQAKGLVERQYQAVQDVVQQVRLMGGSNGRQLVVRLYDGEAEASRAVKALQHAGFDPKGMEKVPVEQAVQLYEAGGRSTLFETMFSGATGGAMWGAVSGILAGFGVLQLPGLGLENAPLPIQESVWAQVALGAIVAGAFVGAVLGTFIGWGIQSEDAYLDRESRQRGQMMLRLHTESDKAARAAEIMAQVNREVRAERQHVLAQRHG